MHPSSGHIKILSASSTFVGLVSSWLSSSSVSVGEVGLRLCLIAAKLFGCTEVTVIDGTFNLLLGMNFPEPMSYALQTRMPSFSNLMLFKRLTPSIFTQHCNICSCHWLTQGYIYGWHSTRRQNCVFQLVWCLDVVP